MTRLDALTRTTTEGAPDYPIAAGVWRILNVVGGIWAGTITAMAVIGVAPPNVWPVAAAAILALAVWYIVLPGVWIW